MTELNLEAANLSEIIWLDLYPDSENITSVSLRNALVSPSKFGNLFYHRLPGIGEGHCPNLRHNITKLDLSGIDFTDITDLESLYRMDDLTDLWLVNSQNMDAVLLDVLLDNLETIEGTDTEGILYVTQADLDAFNTAGGGLLAAWDAEQGHHVEFLSDRRPEPRRRGKRPDVDAFVEIFSAVDTS